MLNLRQSPCHLQRHFILPGLRSTGREEKVLEAVSAAREALAVEDRIGDDEREELRAIGVFERFAVDAIESVVSLFELFAQEQFEQRVSDAQQVTRDKGIVFQRLDDTAALLAEHADIDLVTLAGEDRWQEAQKGVRQRHVFVHNGGIIDEPYLRQVPMSPLKLGQRLVVRRTDAERRYDDLDFVVREFAGPSDTA